MIAEIYKFWFFWSKNGRFVTHICFPKKGLKPLFYSVLGVSAFWAKVSKKGKFWKATQKWLITEKLFFGIFAVFLGGLLFFLVFCFGFCFLFCFLVFLYKKNLLFPLDKGIFCLFSVFLFLSPLAFFGLPLFLFLFLCLSLSLSLSLYLSIFFFSFFLPSCLSFLLSFGSLFLSLSFFLFLLCFLSWKEQHQNIKLQVLSSSMFSLFFGFLSFFVSSSFFLSLLFPDFKLCFLFNIKVLISKQTALKTNKFGQKGVATKRFLSTCVLENVKS